MTYVAIAAIVAWALTGLGSCWLLDRERERHHQAQHMLQRQLVALADKEAVYASEEPSKRPSGNVSYMDEAREALNDANRT